MPFELGVPVLAVAQPGILKSPVLAVNGGVAMLVWTQGTAQIVVQRFDVDSLSVAAGAVTVQAITNGGEVEVVEAVSGGRFVTVKQVRFSGPQTLQAMLWEPSGTGFALLHTLTWSAPASAGLRAAGVRISDDVVGVIIPGWHTAVIDASTNVLSVQTVALPSQPGVASLSGIDAMRRVGDEVWAVLGRANLAGETTMCLLRVGLDLEFIELRVLEANTDTGFGYDGGAAESGLAALGGRALVAYGHWDYVTSQHRISVLGAEIAAQTAVQAHDVVEDGWGYVQMVEHSATRAVVMHHDRLYAFVFDDPPVFEDEEAYMPPAVHSPWQAPVLAPRAMGGGYALACYFQGGATDQSQLRVFAYRYWVDEEARLRLPLIPENINARFSGRDVRFNPRPAPARSR